MKILTRLFLLLFVALNIDIVYASDNYDVFRKSSSSPSNVYEFYVHYYNTYNNIKYVDDRIFNFYYLRTVSNSTDIELCNENSTYFSCLLLMYGNSDGEVQHKLMSNYEYVVPINNGFIMFDYYTKTISKKNFLYLNVSLADNSFNVSNNIKIEEDFTGYNFNDYDIYNENNKIIFLIKKSNYSEKNFQCKMFEITNSFDSFKTLNCNLENLEKYFPEDAFEYKNNLIKKGYDTKDDYLVVADDSTLRLSKGNELIFEKQIDNDYEKFVKALFIKNKIIVIKQRIIPNGSDIYTSLRHYKKLDNPMTFSDSILVYDFKGNLLQTIFENASYMDIAVKEDEAEFAVSKRYIYGLSSFVYSGNFGSAVNYNYEVYKFNTKYSLEGDYLDSENIGENVVYPDDYVDEKVDVNPDTEDLALIMFIVLLVISFVIVIKNRKLDF